MTLLIVLDDAHMGNALFMKSFGHGLKQVKQADVVLIHASERYTDALIQTGLFRADASVRAAREINRKLATWLADYGVSCSSVHGDQRGLIRRQNGELHLDRTRLHDYATQTVRVFSTLIEGENGESTPISLSELTRYLEIQIPADHVVIFSLSEADSVMQREGPTHFSWKHPLDFIEDIPDEFKSYTHPVILASSASLATVPTGRNLRHVR